MLGGAGFLPSTVSFCESKLKWVQSGTLDIVHVP